jgi:hypothetical protein
MQAGEVPAEEAIKRSGLETMMLILKAKPVNDNRAGGEWLIICR